MSQRVRELVDRQTRLQRRCAAERASIAREIASIEARLAGVDRVAGLARRTVSHPVVVAGGIVVLLTIGRLRGLRFVGRLFLLANAARRLLQTARLFQGVSRSSNVSGGL